MKTTTFLVFAVLLFSVTGWSAKPVITNIDLARQLGKPIVKERPDLGVALLLASDEDMERLSELAHENGHCGGFELIPDLVTDTKGSMVILSTREIDRVFESLEVARNKSNQISMQTLQEVSRLQYDPNIDAAVQAVSTERVMDHIEWLQGFGGRYHDSDDPNRHVLALADFLKQLGGDAGLPHEVHLIEHRNTRQHSVLFRLIGSERPQETVVLGGHLDSINHRIFGNRNNAPGADDNASGSADLLETLQILLARGESPKRTIEFMWYAAEEVGLIGSAEIASQYNDYGRDVLAVLQLDMTLVPGSGVFTIASMSDYTSPWLRDLFLQMNENYIHAQIVDSRCGYGCSDHASWFRRGYPTLFPHESIMNPPQFVKLNDQRFFCAQVVPDHRQL